MKIAPGTPLAVSLRWDADDIQTVGRLAWRDRRAFLEFDPAFLRTGLEISPAYHRLRAGVQTSPKPELFESLHGVFNDSLPDGWGRLLLDRRARQLGVEPATLAPLDRLACVGSGGIGALCYTPEIDPWGDIDPTLDLDKLAEHARLVLDGRAEDVVAELGKAGGSPAGARPKVLIAVDADGHAVHGVDETPIGHEHYLVKFPGRDDPEDIARIEQAYATMARDAGVRMEETRLLPSRDGKGYFAAKRFDRNGERRLHVHSASGLLYADSRLPSLDYRDLIMVAAKVSRDSREGQAMFRLAVFNVVAHNRDDHARQFSFLMERDGSWRMSPAYDLTYAPGPGGEHSTSVGGYGKNISRDALVELGRVAGLGRSDALAIIERIVDTVADWSTYARDYDVGDPSRLEIAAALEKVRPK